MVRFFTPEEVARHNCREDCWVSIYDNVFDITALILQGPGELSAPLLKAAGTSISHWFNREDGDIKTFIDPEKNIRLPYTPAGRFIDVPPPDPRVLTVNKEKPWWLDNKYIVGKVKRFKYMQPNNVSVADYENSTRKDSEYVDAHSRCH